MAQNVLLKISYPAEFHSQTAVEAALLLRAQFATAGRSTGEPEFVDLVVREGK
ncbi:hypothetical protein [Branchiibius sp. NY16-3462-2]|uniref:hypothetical protein n=1 Tax=Branchiibius sp. NY16-3462-2 TaxID=1807500 RepID=UPI000A7332FE|nr:hypothetical protein [Branchiibius sp. NY16-3462-2]